MSTTPRIDDPTTHTAAWATDRTAPPAAAPQPPVTHEPDPAAVPATTAPALNPPTWSGRKTAIAAALAIGFSSVGAIGAAAAMPSGSTGQGRFQGGGFGGPGGPGGANGQRGGFGQQGTNQQGPTRQGFPGGAPGGAPGGTTGAPPSDPSGGTT